MAAYSFLDEGAVELDSRFLHSPFSYVYIFSWTPISLQVP